MGGEGSRGPKPAGSWAASEIATVSKAWAGPADIGRRESARRPVEIGFIVG